jgi:DinB family protein
MQLGPRTRQMNETSQQYVERILGYTEGKQPLDVLSATPQKLVRLTKRISTTESRDRSAVGKWSVNDIVAHLADAEIVISFRIRMILGSPGSPVVSYDQDKWVSSGHYDKRTPHKSLRQFRVLREENLALLRSLEPEQWKHYGVHSERGQESIEHIVRMCAGHDISHLQQIKTLLAGK